MISLKLMGSLALLIYGMKVMSEALQKMTGPQLRHVLGAMTTNRFTGIITGMLLTVAVQSSAATTVMTVSFVNAGLLSLAQAISVIMGANIGTTLSAWIMSAGFSFNISSLVWPVFLIGIILIHIKSRRLIGDFLFGAAFLFFALGTLSLTGKEMDLAHNPAVVSFFSSFDSSSYLTILLFLLIGTVLTIIAQSSAAIMAITMVLCTSGVMTIYQGIALVLGENIGTTLTANLAALSGNTQARRAALAHLVFNLFGVSWVLCVFFPFVDFACSLVGLDATSASESPVKLSFALAAFHTTFNLSNTLILVWFIPQIERLCCWIIKGKTKPEDEEFRLKYIQGGIMRTPEISVLQAQKEITVFCERMQAMLGMVRGLVIESDEKRVAETYERIIKYEEMSDNMEIEIAHYLEQVSSFHLSDDTKVKIRNMMREIGELESIGDSCFNLARALKRRSDQSEGFGEVMLNNLERMLDLCDSAMKQMMEVMRGPKENLSISDSYAIESEIDNTCKELLDRNLTDVNEHVYDYGLGTIYVALIKECEKLGDYIINVVEARYNIK